MKIHALHVSVSEFDGQYFQISFTSADPAADFDLSAPVAPYLLVQRQFEDDDGGVCYIETQDADRFAGHYKVRLVEFEPTRLVLEIERQRDRLIEVTCSLDAEHFRKVEGAVRLILGTDR